MTKYSEALEERVEPCLMQAQHFYPTDLAARMVYINEKIDESFKDYAAWVEVRRITRNGR